MMGAARGSAAVHPTAASTASTLGGEIGGMRRYRAQVVQLQRQVALLSEEVQVGRILSALIIVGMPVIV